MFQRDMDVSGHDMMEPEAPSGRGGAVSCSVILNKGTDEETSCHGYRSQLCKQILFYTLTVLTLGLPLLILYWKPQWRVIVLKTRCPLNRADTVLLKDMYGNLFICSVVVKTFPDGPCTYTDNRRTSKAPSEFTYVDSEEEDSGATADDTTRLTSAPRGGTAAGRVRLKYFDFCHVRYVWHQQSRAFQRLRGLDGNVTCQLIQEKFHNGLSAEEQAQKLNVYGENSIHVEVKSYFKLFIEEVLNPFYIFQICSVILWSLDQYVIYASCIVLISLISLAVSLYETRKQSETLRDMVGTTETTLTVVRGNTGEEEEIATGCLVPGDVLIIPARGCTMMCDAVLISGNAIVNESMLTGESVPVTKTPLAPSESEEIFMPDSHKRHTLFCGTQVIQTRYYGSQKVRAVVVRTGFSTAKGELVRSILFPKPVGFKFYQDAIKFILILAMIAAVGMCYSIFILVREGTEVSKVILRALDIITIVVPPALPAAMTVGTVYAQSRLKKANIFCISPPRINVCGKLKCICFDKTGTLTEDGLDMWGIIPVGEDHRFEGVLRNPGELASSRPFTIAMATCHSLTIIDNELVGDPLDLKMFNSVNWMLEEPGTDATKDHEFFMTYVKPITREAYYTNAQDDKEPFEVGVVRQFTFSSGLQRMSVISRKRGDDHMEIFTKGAPEKIASLCKRESIPDDFAEVLHKYTMKGYRVIALAWKPLDHKMTTVKALKISRDLVENQLEFLGLLIMENQLKPQTTPVIHQLKRADIRTVMVTGDNMLTAVSVARQCGMLGPAETVLLVHVHPPEPGKPAAHITWEKADTPTAEEEDDGPQPEPSQSTQVEVSVDDRYHFAMTGRSFGLLRQHFPQLVDKVMVRGTIYARMSPDQKAQLVEHLQVLGYGVGMCGDGANDCGALKAAHAGISLSEAEASVASPFTSKNPNIECVPIVIREGRAALVTSFGVFKYMALYSIIQFVSVLILYSMSCNLGDWMFLYIDLVIITSLVVLMGHTSAYPHLVSKRPAGSLVSPINVFSILIHILLVIAFQTAAYLYLLSQPWYVQATPSDEANTTNSMEGATIFYASCFQYLMMAFIFSKGKPYRQPIWTNVWFLLVLIFLTFFTTLLLMYPPHILAKFLELDQIPLAVWKFRLTVLGMAAINFLCAVLLESYIVSSRAFSSCVNVVRRKKGPRNLYKLIEAELEDTPNWPPVGEVTMATQIGGPVISQ